MTSSTSFSSRPAFMLALIEQRQVEEAAAAQDGWRAGVAAAERAWDARAGSRNASSAVFTVRLGREEFLQLHREAVVRALPPSVLARNLIRFGLQRREPSEAPRAVRELETLAQRVRSAAL